MNRLSLTFLLAVACGTAGRYRLDKVSDTAPQLRLTKVEVTGDETRITFQYSVSGQQERRIGVHPPGHAGAFVITNVDETESYKLEAIDGIATLPERTIVRRGEALLFTLVFEPIPDGLRKIHVGEGKYRPESGEISWHFLDVKLE